MRRLSKLTCKWVLFPWNYVQKHLRRSNRPLKQKVPPPTPKPQFFSYKFPGVVYFVQLCFFLDGRMIPSELPVSDHLGFQKTNRFNYTGVPTPVGVQRLREWFCTVCKSCKLYLGGLEHVLSLRILDLWVCCFFLGGSFFHMVHRHPQPKKLTIECKPHRWEAIHFKLKNGKTNAPSQVQSYILYREVPEEPNFQLHHLL